MLLALVWWTILLSRYNHAQFEKNTALIELQTKVNQGFATINTTQVYSEFQRNKYMILGEGLVFGLSLIAGMWFIQRAHSREVRQSQKEKNFLLSVTHELKTPVASIRLLTETMLKRSLPDAQARELKESILSESDRLAKLVDNLLLASRLDAGYAYYFESVSLQQILTEVAGHLKSQYPEATIIVNTASAPLICDVDSMAFSSVCTNLIENSIKYSSPPATIEILGKEGPQEMILEFKDRGIGIPEKENEQIFKQFYRIGNEETRKTKGTGLGLFIVQKIVQAHNGKIKVSQNQPQGTIFTLSIPKKNRLHENPIG